MATEKRIFCDTNFLLDIFDKDRTRHADAIALLWYANLNAPRVRLLASITSFKDAYYILCRLYHDEAAARESISDVMGNLVAPVDMLAIYGAEAMSSGEPDFEDGLIRACAEHEGACAIITSDEPAFARSHVPAYSPTEFLQREGFDYDVIEF